MKPIGSTAAGVFGLFRTALEYLRALFWTAADLEEKLGTFQDYFNLFPARTFLARTLRQKVMRALVTNRAADLLHRASFFAALSNMRTVTISNSWVGPDWLDTDQWDIEAKAPEGTAPARNNPINVAVPDTIALMLQNLLEDRFKLRAHRETRELPVYELTVSKGGAKA